MGAVLNTVYNNYLAAYSPRQLTKYDTHKKSELRSVYNSIVKLNKDAPWYLPTTNKDTQHYAVSLKENARELHNAIAHDRFRHDPAPGAGPAQHMLYGTVPEREFQLYHPGLRPRCGPEPVGCQSAGRAAGDFCKRKTSL